MAAIFETLGAVTASGTGTVIAPGADTKGSYVPLTASSGIAAKMLYAYVTASNTSEVGSYAIDIATGAAASEVVRIPDIYVDCKGNAIVWMQHIFRVDETVFAAGTRIAVRAEGPTVTGTEEVQVILVLCDTDLLPLASPAHVTYGVTLGADVKGTVYDPGASANTKAGYTPLTAAAAATLQHFGLTIGRNGNNVLTDANGLIDVATGGAGSEAVKIANLPIAAGGATDIFAPTVYGPFPGDIFQSARISVNAQLSITDAVDRLFTVTARGTTGTAKVGPRAGYTLGVM